LVISRHILFLPQIRTMFSTNFFNSTVMASKKLVFLAGIFCLFSAVGFAQTGGSYDVKDSSVVPTKSMPQHTEFLNGAYDFPAKPRNQWEIGIKGGLPFLSSDVRSRLGFGGGLHVRKAFGYIFSMRLEYDYLATRGLNFAGSQGYVRNPVLSGIYGTGGTPIFYNYKTNVQELGLQGIFTLNNIRFHKAKTGINFYALVGVAGMVYDAKHDALDANGNPYNFASITGAQTFENRKDIKSQLKSLLDGSYETTAQRDPLQPKLFGKPFKPAFNVGIGMQIKLSNRLNIALEDKFTIVKSDLLDGVQFQENFDSRAPGAVAQSRDYDSYHFPSIGLNINLGGKAVEPLWWLNPLDYAYSEIRNPRLMRLPKPVLPDADGDGITDQFDQEQTPEGAPVDSHGVSLDTDGDGVPDYLDKELVTPTYCQPVDADGVGKCPCPDSTCFEGYIKANDCAAQMGALPSIMFSGRSVKVSNDAQSLLATVASRMRSMPACKVVVVGYCSSTKSEQQLSWDRVNAVINYLVEKEGISSDRFIWNYGEQGGDCNTVDIRGAAVGEEGPSVVPAPHPNLRRNK